MASSCRHRTAPLIPTNNTIVAAGQVVVAALPPHARARVGHSIGTLAGVAARDHSARRLVETGDAVLARALEASGRAWVLHALAGAVGEGDSAASLIVVLSRTSVARIGDGVVALAGHLLRGDGVCMLLPRQHAIGMAVAPLRALGETRVRDAERAVRRATATSDGTARLVPAIHPHVAVAILGHDEVVSQLAILHR